MLFGDGPSIDTVRAAAIGNAAESQSKKTTRGDHGDGNSQNRLFTQRGIATRTGIDKLTMVRSVFVSPIGICWTMALRVVKDPSTPHGRSPRSCLRRF